MSRKTALAVLRDSDSSGRFASAALSDVLSSSRLSPRDKSLVSQLVYGTIRRRATIDLLAEAFSGRSVSNIDKSVIWAVRLGIFQIVFLDRVPPHAAINETVNAVPERLGRKRDFVNAVLRNAIRKTSFADGPVTVPSRELALGNSRKAVFAFDAFPSPANDPAGHISAVHSHPKWLVKRWIEAFGMEKAEDACARGNDIPSLHVYPNPIKGFDIEKLSVAFGVAGVPCLLIQGGGLSAAHAGDVAVLPGFSDGAFFVQDETQASAVAALDPKPGESLLDVCSAPGGKSVRAALLMADRGMVVSVDMSPDKTRRIAESKSRMGLSSVEPLCADAMRLPFRKDLSFDKVLIDAPCSNTGVLSRRAEARWRIKETDIVFRFPEMQLRLLRASARMVRPGGALLYSVCSVERDEGGAVAARFVMDCPEFTVVTEKLTLQGRDSACGGYYALFARK